MTRDVDIAYIAGLIDGEGCIRVKKNRAYECQGRATPGYHASVQVRMVDEGAIRFLAENLGGWYYREKKHAAKGRPLFCYSASDKRAETILRAILPYLRVKQDAAENVLALRDLQSETRAHRTKIVGYRDFPNQHGTVRRVPNLAFTDEYVSRCEAFFLRSKGLNLVGARAA